MGTVALGLVIYKEVRIALIRQFDRRIAAETSFLLSEYNEEGLDGLKSVIARREHTLPKNGLGYALFDLRGHRIAGTFEIQRPLGRWHNIKYYDRVDKRIDPARFFGVKLPTGERLIVVADVDELAATDRLIVILVGVTFGAMAMIGLLQAWILRIYLHRRLSKISDTAEGILEGDFSRRISVQQKGDEIDRLAEVLNTMLDRISDLIENLDQVSSDIAHDLRTPLTRLRAELERGLRQTHSRPVIERAIEQSDEILALFSSILRLSEINTGRLRAGFRTVDLSALITEICESYIPAYLSEGWHLRHQVQPSVYVYGDRGLLAQAFVNLLDNAQLHTPLGTEVKVCLSQQLGFASIIVSDDGPGIPQAEHERIVRRFARLDESRNRPGYGLGLSIVAAIAKAHGGALTFKALSPGLEVTIGLRADEIPASTSLPGSPSP